MNTTVQIRSRHAVLEGELEVPSNPRGVVLFAHGSGSGRHSPRNQHVARRLQESGLATLLMDLLTREEEIEDLKTGHLRFDIGLLAERLESAVQWLSQNSTTSLLRIGCFGASTGGGAALVAAANCPERICAVVSRGGRPDLAGPSLPLVQAPTLLIVGGNDTIVIRMNQEALEQLSCQKELRIIPGATHLFEEPGALEEVARLAVSWFHRHLNGLLAGASYATKVCVRHTC